MTLVGLCWDCVFEDGVDVIDALASGVDLSTM